MTIPTGGAAVSASTGAHSSPVTVTVPAGSYYLTQAGGVSSLLTTLQNALNFAIGGTPSTAAALTAAVGYGTATGGWLCQEASGNLAPTIGAVTLTANGTPTYQSTGPGQGNDYAIGFDATSEYFDGGANFDVGANDLFVAFVAKLSSTATTSTVISKAAAALASGWAIYYDAGSTTLSIAVVDGGGVKVAGVNIAAVVGEYFVCFACVDRGAGAIRIAVRGLTSGTTALSPTTAVSGNITTGATFRLGADLWLGSVSTSLLVAALYVGTGSGVATGLSANISTALDGLYGAVNSFFTASLSTATGRITCSNSFWPSYVQWTSTNLRDVLGFEYDFDYPQTAAQMAAALGYGTWTSGAGYLCNESSGDLAAVFGAPATLTASSLVYSHQGARGGNDKAIGFDAGTDYADGGVVFDPGASGDLVVVVVAKWSSLVTATAVSQGVDGGFTQGWALYGENGGNTYGMGFRDSGGLKTSTVGSAGWCAGEWHVGISVVDKSTGKMRFGTAGLCSGTTTVSAETTVSTHVSGAADFRLGASAWLSASSALQIGAVYAVTGSGVATGLSANLSTALSNFATSLKSQTGSQQAKGVVLLDCPLSMDGDPTQAPRKTDLRQSEGPTGVVLGLAGNYKYRHTNLVWSAVPRERVWESATTYDNASWETFLIDTQYGFGHSWFTPSSRVQIYWDNAGSVELVGGDANDGDGLSGWFIKGLTSVEPRMTSPPWTGLWRIEIPEIVSDG
jgi:hypothetical protein